MEIRRNVQDTSFKQNIYFKFSNDLVKYKESDVMDLVNRHGKQLGIYKPAEKPIQVIGKDWLVLDEATSTGKIIKQIGQLVDSLKTHSSNVFEQANKLFNDSIKTTVNDTGETRIIDYDTAVNFFSAQKKI